MAKKWSTLKSVRQKKLDHASTLLADSELNEKKIRDSLEQLKIYIQEYQQQLEGCEHEATSVSNLLRTRKFLAKLMDASRGQEVQLENAHQRVLQDKADVTRCRSDLKAIEKLEDKEDRVIKQARHKRESIENDETGLRRYMSPSVNH